MAGSCKLTPAFLASTDESGQPIATMQISGAIRANENRDWRLWRSMTNSAILSPNLAIVLAGRKGTVAGDRKCRGKKTILSNFYGAAEAVPYKNSSVVTSAWKPEMLNPASLEQLAQQPRAFFFSYYFFPDHQVDKFIHDLPHVRN